MAAVIYCPRCNDYHPTPTCPHMPTFQETVKVGVDATLAERGKTYGDFTRQAEITQRIKSIIHTGVQVLPVDMREALDMIASKIARILNGDPNHVDSWHDIAGYATLIEKRLTKGDAKSE